MRSSTWLVCTFTSPIGSAVTPQRLTMPLCTTAKLLIGSTLTPNNSFIPRLSQSVEWSSSRLLLSEGIGIHLSLVHSLYKGRLILVHSPVGWAFAALLVLHASAFRGVGAGEVLAALILVELLNG